MRTHVRHPAHFPIFSKQYGWCTHFPPQSCCGEKGPRGFGVGIVAGLTQSKHSQAESDVVLLLASWAPPSLA